MQFIPIKHQGERLTADAFWIQFLLFSDSISEATKNEDKERKMICSMWSTTGAEATANANVNAGF